MNKQQVYEAAIEVIIDGIKENPKVSQIAIKEFLQGVLDQFKPQPKTEA